MPAYNCFYYFSFLLWCICSMWFNYVLLYTLYVNEENFFFFLVLHATMVLGKD